MSEAARVTATDAWEARESLLEAEYKHSLWLEDVADKFRCGILKKMLEQIEEAEDD